ncbi:hypothetical protein CCAX7_002080 [Capsulimonas corticalis]|uniref:Uncharacterized protein n=1 Tax=Capsulimonas corticalis TaxID=2219043 RepID=A0A402CRU2_9BACT|nr:hypothetical protein [Capsulimonas corticalis]BDI28157.1 hypothetical protein CCAX7_002080 [Capsulimonas corticalis]
MSQNLSASVSASRFHPFRAGLRAARANLAPSLLIQLGMLLVVVGYYTVPAVRHALSSVAGVKAHLGYGFSIFSAVIAGAVIPECLTIVFYQKGRARRKNFENLLFTMPYWGANGFFVDVFYHCQALWFGSVASVPVVAKKFLVDMLCYNPLFSTPLAAICYQWKNGGYRADALRGAASWRFYKERVIPPLVTCWGTWIPIVILIYALPSLLQIPLYSLALSLWVLLLTHVTSSHEDDV